MTRKPTLRTYAQPPQRLLPTLAIPLRHKVRRLIHPRLHLLQLLHLGELTRDDPQDDVLVFGQILQRLEPPGARRVVLEVVSVDVKLLEELGRDAVVAAFGEVPAADKVATAEVHADVQVGGAFGDAAVVEVDVLVQELVGRLGVGFVGCPAGEHLFRAEV